MTSNCHHYSYAARAEGDKNRTHDHSVMKHLVRNRAEDQYRMKETVLLALLEYANVPCWYLWPVLTKPAKKSLIKPPGSSFFPTSSVVLIFGGLSAFVSWYAWAASDLNRQKIVLVVKLWTEKSVKPSILRPIFFVLAKKLSRCHSLWILRDFFATENGAARNGRWKNLPKRKSNKYQVSLDIEEENVADESYITLILWRTALHWL